MNCDEGRLVPLPDFGAQGAAVHYKAWVCTNPECEFNMKIRNGEIHLNEPIIRGARVRWHLAIQSITLVKSYWNRDGYDRKHSCACTP
jgi:hypothetical protein